MKIFLNLNNFKDKKQITLNIYIIDNYYYKKLIE